MGREASAAVLRDLVDGFGFHDCPVPILKEIKRATLALTLILLPLLASCIEPEQVAEDRLAPYKQSLLPAFQGDIASLGEIPRYRIAVRLDADALTLTGRQQVFYTNNEDSKVGNYQRMCSG